MRRRIISSVAALGYGKVAGALVQLALVPAFALHWGLQLYGQWLMLSALPVFLAASDFGFSSAAGNQIIAEVATDSRQEALVTFQSAWTMIVTLSAVVTAITMAICIMLPADFLSVAGGMAGEQARIVLIILALYGIVSLQMFLVAAVARSEGKQAQSITLIATVQLVEGLMVLALVWGGGAPLQVALAYLIIRTIGVLAHIHFTLKAAKWLRLGTSLSSLSRVRELLRPSIAAMVLPLGQAGYLQGTAIAIGAAGGAAMVPLFTALRTLSRVGLQMMSTFILPLMPDFTAAYSRQNVQRVSRFAGLVAVTNIAFAVAFGLIIWLFGGQLLDYWTGATINPPELMIKLTAIAVAIAVIWTPFGNLLLAINRHETYSYIFAVSAAASIPLTYALVASNGVSGAAAVSLLLEIVMLATIFYCVRKDIGRIDVSREMFHAILPHRWRQKDKQ